MKKAGKIIVMFLTVILVAAILLLGVWALISTGRIRTYEGPRSLSEKFVMEINGAPNGFFINSTDTDNPVLLLVSSGPGTDDYFLTDRYSGMTLEDYFTVVYWDYRGMGIAYDSGMDTDSITLDNLISDTHEVTNYLKDRFGKDKIYIMGFSGGTHIALRAAQLYPEDYIAYIGMAQTVTDSTDNDTQMYEYMSRRFTERGDRRALEHLENCVAHLDDGSVRCIVEWREYVDLLHDAGGGTILNKTEFQGIIMPIMLCHCYTISEKIHYITGLKMYDHSPLAQELTDYDYRTLITELQIPAYFISGEDDFNCPWPLVEEYCDLLTAPDKGFYLIPDSAHSPLWENPEVTCDILRQIREATS